MPDGDGLERLAQSVADGVAVDWSAAASEASSEEERRLVETLRALEAFAAAHRGRSAPPATWLGLRLREQLGRGAFGDVFAAWDDKLQREVALKLVPVGSPERTALALEEGRLLARVRHPHVVAVYGADISEGWAGLWMERVRGRTLAAVVADSGPLGYWDLALVAVDVSRALAAVHAARVLHCDIKPSNVMREEGGRTVLMDFGIGRRAGAGAMVTAGTPAFMAPETLDGGPATVRSDVYMVGALLHAASTGEAPPRGAGVSRLGDVRPDLPRPFVDVVERALDGDPSRRWSSADEMAEAFSAVAGASGVGRSRHAWAALLAAGAAAVGLLLLWAWLRSAAPPRVERPAVAAPATSPSPDSVTPATPAPPLIRPSGTPDPFVAPVGSSGRLSDGVTRDGSSFSPYSIRATWRAQDRSGAIELRASRPLSFYLVRELDPGVCLLLFPVAREGQQNPLAAETMHRLRAGAAEEAPRGRLLIVASPTPLVDFESAVERSRVPGAKAASAGIRLSAEALEALRSLEPPGSGRGPRRRLFESAAPLSSHPEMVQGHWVRLVAP